MTDDCTTVAIIDNDASIRGRLQVLIEAAGLTTKLFRSAEEYLNRYAFHSPNCTVLDVQLPGMSGLDLQLRLTKTMDNAPLVFLTAQNDVRASVRAMKAGAVDFLIKPFEDEALLDAVMRGVERDRAARMQVRTLDVLRGRLASLSSRERERRWCCFRQDMDPSRSRDIWESPRTPLVFTAAALWRRWRHDR
jgi:FixJ family two-component response regulator